MHINLPHGHTLQWCVMGVEILRSGIRRLPATVPQRCMIGGPDKGSGTYLVSRWICLPILPFHEPGALFRFLGTPDVYLFPTFAAWVMGDMAVRG